MNLDIGSELVYNNTKYKVLLLHKGFGNSELTLRLQDENGNMIDVPKRFLEKELEDKKPVENLNVNIAQEVKIDNTATKRKHYK